MNINECFLNLSRSLDFSRQGLMRHHQRTALIAAKIGKAAGLQDEDLFELFQASIIHDIGITSWQEKAGLGTLEIDAPWQHCRRGYELMQHNSSLKRLAGIILSHHDRWSGANPSGLVKHHIPLASRIIHLADRVEILVGKKTNVLDQSSSIMEKIRKFRGVFFDPDLIVILEDIAKRDSFWLDLISPWEKECLDTIIPIRRIPIESDYLLDIARLFAQVVDAKCSFTYRHSKGVAVIAKFMGGQIGLPEEECALLEIAGLLHDLGKLSVPTELLEKTGKLNVSEYNIMKQHAYYTYWLLKPVTQTFPLAEWAAFHHERPNGRGYPFSKTDEELVPNARIITIADIVVALREERPYRNSLGWDQIAKIMNELVVVEGLDKDGVSIILDNQRTLDQKWSELS
ncbi:MAG: phosphohydrolase [Firmicutes bacterium HGW-Firmicutes-15]|nr:MAG: phosphohydrolase [Firmicutes bacterium HGW-Firmicutes-15]